MIILRIETEVGQIVFEKFKDRKEADKYNEFVLSKRDVTRTIIKEIKEWDCSEE